MAITNERITSNMWEKIEKNDKNSQVKIGWYNPEKNQFNEVIRWRNSYNARSGANYGLLQIWSILFDFRAWESQGGFNTCGGYNKPIANLEGCLYSFQQMHGDFKFSNCGSISSLLEELTAYIQRQYKVKLFTVTID